MVNRDLCCYCRCCARFLWDQIMKILGFFKVRILKIYGYVKTQILGIYGDIDEVVPVRTKCLRQSARAKRDTTTYCQGYPGQEDDLSLCDNWLFHSNTKSFGRIGLIDEAHRNWFHDYYLLENRHDYIQWLFPIREQSMVNYNAQVLQLHEAKKIREDPAARKRVLESYCMMLDFWGMRLKDEKTGAIIRGDNWEARFRHLNSSYHNYLRITRMLKSLGELGFERLKFPFLRFILREVFLEKTLSRASESCLDYWIHLLRDDKEKGKINEIALEFLGSDEEYP